MENTTQGSAIARALQALNKPDASHAAGTFLGRSLSKLRKNHKAGTGKPRTIEHDQNYEIGTREFVKVSEGKWRYACLCRECRIARGHYPKKTADKN
jgi:hypothetical protein